MSEGTSPTYLVETASTTPLKDGSVLLLVRTTAGVGRLVFPAHLAAHLFRITNPPGSYPVAGGKAPITKPSGALL